MFLLDGWQNVMETGLAYGVNVSSSPRPREGGYEARKKVEREAADSHSSLRSLASSPILLTLKELGNRLTCCQDVTRHHVSRRFRIPFSDLVH